MFAEQFLLPSLTFVHGHGLQLIHDPRPHLHQPMPMPQQLPQITILRIRYPHSRKTIFQQQLQQELGILAVGLLLPDSLGLYLCRISNPQLDTQFRQQPLEPACIPGGLHPHSHADSFLLQVPIKLLCFLIAVIQSPFAAFPSLCICESNLMIARVIIHSHNEHVRLLPPEPLVVDKPQSTRVGGADIVMKSSEPKGFLSDSGREHWRKFEDLASSAWSFIVRQKPSKGILVRSHGALVAGIRLCDLRYGRVSPLRER